MADGNASNADEMPDYYEEDSVDGFDDETTTDTDVDCQSNRCDFEFVKIENEYSDPDNWEEEKTPIPVRQPESSGAGRRKTKANFVRKKRKFELNDQRFRFNGDETLTNDILRLETPIQFFLKMFPEELFKYVSKQTNLYIEQKDPSETLRVTEIDVQQFIGILYIMSLIGIPRVRYCWDKCIGPVLIKETMPVNEFEKLRQNIHFSDNREILSRHRSKTDSLYKIRPIITRLNEAFKSITLEKCLRVDEKIFSGKAKRNFKCSNPNKPDKFGYKMFVLKGASGFVYNFEVETGNESVQGSGERDFGRGGNVVARFVRNIPKNVNYRLYFGNYFSSVPLISFLAEQGILSLAEIRRHRIPDCKLPGNEEFSKEDRGFSVEYVADMDGAEVSVVAWKDDKIVTLISNFVGEHPKSKVRRFERAKGRWGTIEQPHAAAEYGRYAGGSGVTDRWKIPVRSKRWQIRMFYHFLDLAMSNAWLLYKRVRKVNKIAGDGLKSEAFRLEVAQVLCKLGVKAKRKGPSLEGKIQAKKHRGPAQYVPPMEVRLDQSGHWPKWSSKRIRCKHPGCKGLTQTICEKCGVALCYNRSKNCFKTFHTS